MEGKITLITPPDFFENSNTSILFVNLSANDQDIISRWLFEKNIQDNLNFYVYSGEPDVKWFLYALGVCEYKYINLDNANELIMPLSGYVLSKNGFSYKTTNENLASILSHINPNRLTDVVDFLERVFSDKK